MAQTLNLANQTNIRQSLFVRIRLPDGTHLRISSHDTAFNITESDGTVTTYQPLGVLLGVTEFNNELRPTENEVTISLSGVDQSGLTSIMSYFNRTSYGQNSLKGADVTIRRAFFDRDTGVLLNIAGNPSIRFVGNVNNYSLTDEYNQFSDSTTTTISVSCSSILSVLANKISGRKTNRSSMDQWFPADTLTTTGLAGGSGFSCRVASTGGAAFTTGAVTAVDSIVGGSGYTNGTFTNITLTGSETGANSARATIVVSGGAVTTVTITTAGTGYRGPDKSFDRVATITNTTFDFGKPYVAT